MINILRARIHQGHRTVGYPKQTAILPDRFRGCPVIDPTKCIAECNLCADACPTGAMGSPHTSAASGVRQPFDVLKPTGVRQPVDAIDLGKCLFCTDCANACPTNAISYSPGYRLSVRQRDHLIVNATTDTLPQMLALEKESLRLFGRSLKIRQVSAGGCNACEADTNVLSTIVYDLGRFGIQFVASPRHSDGLLITGPVTENMRTALLKTYEAVPSPKIVIVVGACAISGGIFADHPEVHNGVESFLPIDLYIPGCPPHPMTILDGLLGMLGKV